MDSDSDDGPAPLYELCQKTQEIEWQRFHAKLVDIPHTFQLENEHRQMATSHLQKLERGIQTALTCPGYETALERARGKNYLAFLLSLQGKNRDALVLTGDALKEKGEERNLVSLANKAVILWKMGLTREAEEEVKRIEMMKTEQNVDMDYLKVKAKAELAFVYTRMGPSFFLRAIALFEEVLLDPVDPVLTCTQLNGGRHERVKAKEPEKWLWTFGLGLVRRRSLHFMHAPLFHDRNASNESRIALDNFVKVIYNSNSKNLKAKAYAEIATLIGYMAWDEQEKRKLANKAGMWPKEACRKAYELDDNDNSVLCKVGKFLRKAKFFSASKELLEKALTIRPSSTAYHHLGLTYKVLARVNKRIENGEEIHDVRTWDWRDPGRGRGSRSRGRGGGERGTRGRYGHGEGNNTYRKYGNLVCNNRIDYGGRGYNANRSLPNGEGHCSGRLSTGGGPRNSVSRDTARLPQDFHDIQRQLQSLTLEQAGMDTQDTQGSIHSRSARAPADTSLVIFRLKKAIKSPLQSVQILQTSDRYVAETLQNLKKAIEFSAGTNMQAVYDLALVHRYLGEFDRALELLEQLRNNKQTNFSYLTVNALEQTGFILMEKSKADLDGKEAKTLVERAYSMFYMALAKQVQLYSKNPRIQGHTGEIWHSFVELLKKVDRSDQSEIEKLTEKAELFLLMSDTEQSTAQLQKIRRLSPTESQNPNFLKLCIENHAKRKEFEMALALLEILRNTPRSRTMAEFFGDEHYVRKIHLQAAKQALSQNALNESKEHFRAAFLETVSQTQTEESSCSSDSMSCSSDSDSSEGDPETWDVMVIFNRREASHAKKRQRETNRNRGDASVTQNKQHADMFCDQEALAAQNGQCADVIRDQETLHAQNRQHAEVILDETALYVQNEQRAEVIRDQEVLPAGVICDQQALHTQDEQHADEVARVLPIQYANTLADVLKTACGLTVTVMDDDTLPGRPNLDSLVQVMRRSRLVVVLTGQSGRRLRKAGEFMLLTDQAASRETGATVCLLTSGSHVPETLKTRPSMTFPRELLTLSNGPQPQSGAVADSNYTDKTAKVIYSLFKFLIGL